MGKLTSKNAFWCILG